jgi:hypothetical protein
MTMWMGLRRQAKYGKHSGGFMKDQYQFIKLRLRMKLMVNKVMAYGSKKWTNKLMAQRLLRSYTIRYTTLVSIIRSDPKLKRMTPNDILARIINHELLLEEARYVKNLSKGIVSTKKDGVALKVSKKK